MEVNSDSLHALMLLGPQQFIDLQNLRSNPLIYPTHYANKETLWVAHELP